MVIAELERTVLELALPLIEAQGLELWGLELTTGPVFKVCLYVDTPCGECVEGSANIEQCESISRQLGLALEVEDCISQAWVLEVSSPGLERRFFNLEQMRSYIGDVIEARLIEPLAGDRRLWRGKLLSVAEDSFELEPCSVSAEGEILPENLPVVTLPWIKMARVRREHIFVVPQKPGKKSRKKRSG